ncbi:hypothetical protein H0X32_03965 [Patescibacteria group bacterium]|nr:hypothetical protein [Patescibacteria group bacterium]
MTKLRSFFLNFSFFTLALAAVFLSQSASLAYASGSTLFQANPDPIQPGGTSRLTWHSSPVNLPCHQTFDPADDGSTALVTWTTPPLSQTTTYSVTCGNPPDTTTVNVPVVVSYTGVLDASCYPEPSTVGVNQSVTWLAGTTYGAQPYTYTWSGTDGFSAITASTSGSSLQRYSYPAPGVKSASIHVIDSDTTQSDSSIVYTTSTLCNGPVVPNTDRYSDVEDGGTFLNAQTTIRVLENQLFNSPTYASYYKYPADFTTNPQNYCVQGEIQEQYDIQDPKCRQFGAGTCPFELEITLHNNPNTTRAQLYPGDERYGFAHDLYSTSIYQPGSSQSSPKTIDRLCSAKVTVTAPDVPIASLSANPISVPVGTPSNLTYECTNSTSASITPATGLGTISPTGSHTIPTPNLNDGTTYTLKCINGAASDTAQADIDVTQNLPDLTASAATISPSPAITGVRATLSGRITNRDTPTRAVFKDFFQQATSLDADGNGVNVSDLYPSVDNPAMDAPDTNDISIGHIFDTAGTYYVRVCADKSARSDTGLIVESNEDNNCSTNWTRLTVNDDSSAPGLSCSPSRSTAKIGDSITWTPLPTGGFTPTSYAWSDSNGTPQTGNGSTFQNSYSTDGNYSVHLVASPGAVTADCSVVAIGTGASCNGGKPPTIKANGHSVSTQVQSGSKVHINWDATDTSGTCTVKGPGLPDTSLSCSTVPPTGASSPDPTILTQSTYTITCGSGSASVTVNVVPKFQEF